MRTAASRPQAALVDPAIGATLEGVFRTDATSVTHGVAAMGAQRAFLTGFMRRYVAR
jgi:hypothetical protein